jgi:hypothetical protein
MTLIVDDEEEEDGRDENDGERSGWDNISIY